MRFCRQYWTPEPVRWSWEPVSLSFMLPQAAGQQTPFLYWCSPWQDSTSLSHFRTWLRWAGLPPLSASRLSVIFIRIHSFPGQGEGSWSVPRVSRSFLSTEVAGLQSRSMEVLRLGLVKMPQVGLKMGKSWWEAWAKLPQKKITYKESPLHAIIFVITSKADKSKNTKMIPSNRFFFKNEKNK